MEKAMWINRFMNQKVSAAAKSRPAVLLTGARQTGKSSLLKKIFPDAEYITFDSLLQVEAARERPDFFLKQFRKRVVLDEIQYVPELFRELKIIIDENPGEYGKWVMTGSQQFALMENVSESLAGRLQIFHLETVSAAELRATAVEQIEDFLWKGGYPEVWANPHLNISDYFESYVRTYLERDLREIIQVNNLVDFRRFLRVLATRVGQLVNYKNLAGDVGVSDATIRKWLSALQISGLIYTLPPYFSNISKRLIKSPKLYFADHGLLCHLLGITDLRQWHDCPYKGSLWENFVMMELVKTQRLVVGENLFFYRDHNDVEIDFVIEKPGELIMVEAKAGESADARKLNFNKVAPLFEDRFTVRSVLALNMNEKKVQKLKKFERYNPLYVEMA
jgi:predicted AAA+ superfamily ATPase